MPGMHSFLSSVRDGICFLGTLSFIKVWNYFLLRGSYLSSTMLGRPYHLGMPVSLSMEPATSCNLRCPECPSGAGSLTRPRGMMAAGEFRKVIDQAADRLAYLMLYFQGEPMMNPDIFAMIGHARQKNIYTTMSANGHFLDDDNAHKLVASGLNRLVVSIDGTDQETYRKYRIGGDLEKVKDGVRMVAKWKKELKTHRPLLVIQFLVFSFNQHQVPAMRQMARELGADRLVLKSAQIYSDREKGRMSPAGKKYSRYRRESDGQWRVRKVQANRCFRMWSGAVVTWDGTMVPCCFDKDAHHPLGDTKEKPFREIWKGKASQNFRQQVFTARERIGICRNCTE